MIHELYLLEVLILFIDSCPSYVITKRRYVKLSSAHSSVLFLAISKMHILANYLQNIIEDFGVDTLT